MSNLARSILLLSCAWLLFGATPLEAASPQVILVVDVQRILDESLAAKSIQKQLETQRSKFQTEIENEENGLRQAEQDLAKAHDQLTPDVYSDREQQLRQRFLAVERHVQARRKVLDQAFTDSMNTVHDNLTDIVTAVAHERNANLVLIKQQVLWTDKALDITDEVLSRLNAKLPQITVKMAPEEKEESDQPAPKK
jgi:outer membrane protein